MFTCFNKKGNSMLVESIDKNKKLTICYFGKYNPEFSRNKIYITGLERMGFSVIKCRVDSGTILKYIQLFIKHWQIRREYDFIVVGYPDRLSVLFARIISGKPIVFDALCSLYEIVVISRKQFTENSIKALFYKMLDYIAVKSAHFILVETENQRNYFIKNFGARPECCIRLYTGADDSVFYFDDNIEKAKNFTVVFRGRFLPEAGVEYIIEAAKLLEGKGVNFLILGGGHRSKNIDNIIIKLSPKNLILITEKLGFDDLRSIMLSSHVSLGQFKNNERLERTIPHKAFESLSMKLPYITGRAGGVSELLTDGKDCLMVNLSDPDDLADKILKLKNNPEFAKNIVENGYQLYKEKLTPEALAAELIKIVSS